MRLRKVKGLVSVAATLALLMIPRALGAANINTSAWNCIAEGTTLQHTNGGVKNISAATAQVFCAIPRSPLGSGLVYGTFYLDGDNPAGKGTACIVYSYDFDGTLLGSQSLASTDSHYDIAYQLPAAQLPMYAYTMAGCLVPAGGILRGLTSVQ